MMDLPRMSLPRSEIPVFIRFGLWSARSRNHATGTTESGVSVFPAVLSEHNTVRLAWEQELEPWELQALWGRCAWVVTGKVVATGSDGEPVLQGVRALGYAIEPDSIPAALRTWQ